MAIECCKQRISSLTVKTLNLEYTFTVTNPVTQLLEYSGLRSSPIHNTIWGVRKCLAFIRRSAGYHRTTEGRCWSADKKWLHKHYGCANVLECRSVEMLSVSTTLLHICVLIARILISNWRDTSSLTVCISWGFRREQSDKILVNCTVP